MIKGEVFPNNRMDCVSASKLLQFHKDKSCFTVFGSKKAKQHISQELSQSQLSISGRERNHLSEGGLAASAALTVDKRSSLVTRAIYEIRCVVDDCRTHIVGGITAGIDLWEVAVLPMLLNNSECWLELSHKTIEQLEKLQFDFLRTLLAVGSGCPNLFLLSETGLLLMEMSVVFLLNQFGIFDLTLYSKFQFKKLVKEKIRI